MTIGGFYPLLLYAPALRLDSSYVTFSLRHTFLLLSNHIIFSRLFKHPSCRKCAADLRIKQFFNILNTQLRTTLHMAQ